MEEFEWLSSNVLTAYPFEERQPDLVHELFVDAYIEHNKYRTKDQRIRLAEFDPGNGSSLSSSLSSSSSDSSSSGAGIARAVLRYEDGTLLAAMSSATDAFKESVFGAYTIYEWRRHTLQAPAPNVTFNPPTAGFTDEDISVKLVVFTENLAKFSFPLYLQEGYLIASLVNPRVTGVRRLFVRLPDVVVGLTAFEFYEALGEKVIVKAGTNMLLNPLTAQQAGITESARRKSVAEVSAIAGAGEGYYVSCDPNTSPGIRTINKVPPNKLGSLMLEGLDCLWVETLMSSIVSQVGVYPNTDYLGVLQTGLLALHNNCGACCDCPDYKEAYEAISRLWERAKVVAMGLEAARGRYNQFVVQVRDMCALNLGAKGSAPIKAILTVRTHPDYRISTSMMLLNSTGHGASALPAQVLRNVKLKFNFKDQPGLHAIKDHATMLGTDRPPERMLPTVSDTYLSPTQAYSTAEILIPDVPVDGSVGYSFEGRFDEVAGFARQGKVILVEVVVTVGTPALTKAASGSATLQGPEELT
jgi:hypothetical protein